ncbi:hypothetical protein CSUI_006300, partial [Cystoisospora suis]
HVYIYSYLYVSIYTWIDLDSQMLVS